ncbi:MAG: sigma-70 family RNA polymerase sigma factor [Bacteroidetes bacterium]|nr:sigma-70 family RNA polymerase sigma factor [Bacteroidota bacterium]
MLKNNYIVRNRRIRTLKSDLNLKSSMKNKSEYSDQDLAKLVSEGNEDAFQEMFRRYYSPLFYFSIKRLHNESEVKDILQNTFLKIWSTRSDLDASRSLKSYLFTITNNQIIDHFRKTSSHHLDFDDFSDEQSMRQHTEAETASGDLTDQVRAVIERQPDGIKAVYLLSKHEGYKNQEIAVILGISVKTVEARMTKLIKAIRENLDKGFSS